MFFINLKYYIFVVVNKFNSYFFIYIFLNEQKKYEKYDKKNKKNIKNIYIYNMKNIV